MRIGIIGAGMIGSTVGKLWIDAGHEVRFASRHPEELQSLARRLGKSASSGTPAEAAAFGEVVMVAVPLMALPELARTVGTKLVGKVVIDTTNAYEKRDRDIANVASRHPRGSAGWAEEMFPKARWVKGFNAVYYKTLEKEAHRNGDKVGIPLAGDDPAAIKVVAHLARDAGFYAVPCGPLARGKEFEPGTSVYNSGMSGQQLRKLFG
jgi:predicted dinucleotide-binding enzyme